MTSLLDQLEEAVAGGRLDTVAELVPRLRAEWQDCQALRETLEARVTQVENELCERDALQLVEAAARDKVQNERDIFFRTSFDLLCVTDDRLAFIQGSTSWERLLGYTVKSLLGRTLFSLFHPEDHALVEETVKRALHEQSLNDFEVRMKHASGDWRWISWTATWDPERRRFFSIGRDVTERKARARDEAQAQKLEAIGELAAGVAHEINTPVQFVGDNVVFVTDAWRDLLALVDGLREVQPQRFDELARTADLEYLRKEVPTALSDARDGLRTVKELIKALKEFSHPDTASLEACDVNAVIRRAAVLARGEVKHVAELELDLGTLPDVRCQPNSLVQVLVNLLVNASHAIEERAALDPQCPRRITVRSRVVGPELAISVEDTGQGVPAAVRDRIFEPFFTTKPIGKGTGQGLSLVRSVVVQRHKGRIQLDTAVGKGSTFTLLIPLQNDELVGEAA